MKSTARERVLWISRTLLVLLLVSIFGAVVWAQQPDADRSISLFRALQSGNHADFRVAGRVDFLSWRDGQPVMIFSGGVRVADLSATTEGGEADLKVSVLGRLTDLASDTEPVYETHNLDPSIQEQVLKELRGDQTAFLTYNLELPVSPGVHEWKAVFRDEHSGKIGTYSARLEVPDFRRPSTPSTLLLTRDLESLQEDSTAQDPGQQAASRSSTLEVGGLRYIPQPEPVFRRGDVVHLLYQLCNATDEDFQVAEKGMQFALLRGDEPVEEVEAYGQPHVDREQKIIQYTAHINTANLEPGEYHVLAVLPNYQTREVPHLERTFTVR